MSKGLLATTGCAALLAFSLSACGGGSGPKPIPAPLAPTPPPTPPPPPPPPTASQTNYDTAEYRASNSATSSQAIAAYQAGASGKGVKLAVIDSGINPSLPEFAGRIDPASRDVAGDRGVSDEDGHGTAVTAVAAAARNDAGMHGVAFDATIVSFRSDSPGSCATTGEDEGCKFNDSAIATGIDAARLAGARVVNLSLGGDGVGSAVLSAMQRAVTAGMVIVISAGNEGAEPEGVNPSKFASIPASYFPGNVIVAGSVGVSDGLGGTDLNQLSTFSNKAGTSAVNYLAALGYRNRTIDHTGAGYLYSGTSFAAPTITGAVALMAHAFPNLTATQIVDILFRSADDLGAAGVDAIFGRGRLNIASAFKPIGTTSMADSGTAVDTSDNGDLPSAAGDAGAGQEAMGAIILDGYSRAFVLDLAKTLRAAPQAEPLARALQGGVKVAGANAGPVSIAMTVAHSRDDPAGFRLHRLGIGPDDARQARLIAGSAIARLDSKTAVAFGFAQGAKAIERQLSGAQAGAFLIARDVSGDPGFSAKRDSSVAIRRDLGPVSVTMSGETGDVWQQKRTSATGSPYSWASVSVDKDFGRTWLSGSVSRLDEKQSLLGGRMGNALGGGGSNSLFADLEARRELGAGWSLGVNARRGWTEFAAGSFESGAYGADLAKTGVLGSGDRLGLRISQPLRVEKGGFNVLLPTAYDYATETATSSMVGRSLTPSGREIDGELSYSTTIGRGWLGGNLFVRKDPGHVAKADDDYGAAIRYTLGF